MSHRNARLTAHGRRLLVERVRSGRPVAHVAAEMGISRPTAHKWVRRWRAEGDSGLIDRSSRPRTTPHRTAAATEAHVCRLRQDRKLGPARIGPILGLPASTVHRILTRHGLKRLAFLDRPTGQPIRRYERDRPGELVHVDVKKRGRTPDGGGHRALGHQAGRARRSSVGFDYVHSAVDDHNRPAYSEIHPDEKAATCAAFLRRAAAFFADSGVDRIDRVLTDNAWPYRKSLARQQALADLGATGKLTRAYRPQTNGKVERFNRFGVVSTRRHLSSRSRSPPRRAGAFKSSHASGAIWTSAPSAEAAPPSSTDVPPGSRRRRITLVIHAAALHVPRQHGCVHRLARDAGISQPTGCRHLHEGISLLAAQAPDPHEVDLCRAEATRHVVLDGRLSTRDRLSRAAGNGNDLRGSPRSTRASMAPLRRSS